MDQRALLRRTADLAADFLDGLDERPVRASAGLDELRARLGGELPETGEPAIEAVEALAAAADPGLVASAGPRYFGFVIGGSVPASVAADWLTSAWDQNAGLYASSPAAAVAEEVAAGWVLDILDLPREASVGFTTGATMANSTGLAAARTAVLRRAGWDVDGEGLRDAPAVTVLTSDESHSTIFASLRLLGLGSGRAIRVPTDGQGRMTAAALRRSLSSVAEGPTIVCAQAGNVNTGAVDELEGIADACAKRNAWLHVDGAFGLWARASARLRAQTAGIERADSWTTDAHKWLNVPYDSGISIVRDRAAHHAAMTVGASYYVETAGAERDPFNWVPETSRRARGFALWAALRSLGRSGVREMVERDCGLARRIADRLAAEPGVDILNDVVLNQVLVRFGGDDGLTRDVIARVQAEGTCWLGGTTWHGLGAMRISVSGWWTTDVDADRSVAAILDAFEAARAAGDRRAATTSAPGGV
ncbi:MAG TPA: aminotransferase class V-fold PLP-dependent enzyme [Candidatus Limnocylindrales bacterium]